jgi:hypothetical protein
VAADPHEKESTWGTRSGRDEAEYGIELRDLVVVHAARIWTRHEGMLARMGIAFHRYTGQPCVRPAHAETP